MTNVSAPLSTQRSDLLDRLAQPHVYDLAVIGGGATGLGVALDARLCLARVQRGAGGFT